jgi:hypothetical protein
MLIVTLVPKPFDGGSMKNALQELRDWYTQSKLSK